MISAQTIQAVKDRANIIEVVSDVVTLKRQGSSFVGLCPFHNEKTSSFHVREQDGFYHCFGCGVSGSAIDFIMRMRGLSFPEAIEELAGRYGIEVKRDGIKKSEGSNLRQPVLRANKIALDFFRKNIALPEAQQYLVSRGLTSQCVQAFGIGFAPKSFNALCQTLKQQNIQADIILKAGLAKRNSQGDLFDSFRARLIFPIYEDAQRILGFGGRVLPALLEEKYKETTPKYLNSSESPVYHKSKVLYGLPQASSAIRDTDEVIVVEGYMDVVSLWQVAVQNVVATCGTAVTEQHVLRLSRLAKRVTVMFDADTAGRRAAAKSFHLFLNSGIDVSALFLPEGEDPDSVAIKHGQQTAQYLESLERHSLLHCYLDGLTEKYAEKLEDGSFKELGAAAKGKLCEELTQSLRAVKNVVEQGALVEESSGRLKVSVSELRALMGGGKPKIGVPKTPTLVNNLALQNNPGSKVAKEANSLTFKAIHELPALDRDVLLSVMAEKDLLLERVLRSPDFVGGLDASTLTFLEGLQSIMINQNLTDDERKDEIKGLLSQFGGSWGQHWKKAYAMREDKGVNLERVYNECAQAIKKTKLVQILREIDSSIVLAGTESDKLNLIHEKVMLSRRLADISRTTN